MSDNNSNNNNNREQCCTVCRRSENHAGKMLTLPGGMPVCIDCLQKTLDNFGGPGMDFSGMGMPGIFPGMPVAGFPMGAMPGNMTPAAPEGDDLPE